MKEKEIWLIIDSLKRINQIIHVLVLYFCTARHSFLLLQTFSCGKVLPFCGEYIHMSRYALNIYVSICVYCIYICNQFVPLMHKNDKEMSVLLLWPFVPHHYIILRSFSTWFSNNVIDLTQRVEAPYISIKMTNWQIWPIHRNIQLTNHNNQLDFRLLYVTNKNIIPNRGVSVVVF